MSFDEKILNNCEKAIFLLRKLFKDYGYEQYKVSKFEEYDLYMKNKSFLVSENVLTFTDTNGKLMALKPDVTLSIIKNTKDDEPLKKVYYNEVVYRPNDENGFREINQTGLECIGDIDTSNVCWSSYLLFIITGTSFKPANFAARHLLSPAIIS